ncbi:spore germination protein [Bacillus cereus]
MKITCQLYTTIDSSSTASTFNHDEKHNTLTTHMKKNIQTLQKIFENNPYFIIKYHHLLDREMAILHFQGLSDMVEIRDYMLRLGILDQSNIFQTPFSPLHLLKQLIAPTAQITNTSCINTIVNALLSGNTVFLFGNYDQSHIVSTGGNINRSISEPPSQNVLRGPRDGFTESLQTNILLIFQRIKNPKLCVQQKTIGTNTNTDISVLYMQGIANETILNTLIQRIDKIKIEAVLESAYIEPYLLDDKYSPFPTIYHTERPDIVAAALLKGRIAVLIDKTPFVLIVPSLFQHFFTSK